MFLIGYKSQSHLPEYLHRNDVPIVIPSSCPDFPWPDASCEFGLFSLHKLEPVTKRRRITHVRKDRIGRIKTTIQRDKPDYLRILHLAVEYKRCGKKGFNNHLPFVMGYASLQAEELYPDLGPCAVYGVSVDLEQHSLFFYGMVKRKVLFSAPLFILLRYSRIVKKFSDMVFFPLSSCLNISSKRDLMIASVLLYRILEQIKPRVERISRMSLKACFRLSSSFINTRSSF